MALAYDQNKYTEQAKQQYDSSYNNKVTSLKNQLAQNQQSLDQQKTSLNTNYDTQVKNQNLNNKINKNGVSNAILGRGLNNSSIAVSGLAEQDAKNTRLVGDINTQRTSSINDIESQKTLLAQNLTNTLTQMEGDRESELQTLARQMYSEDWNRDYQERQLAQQLAIARMNSYSYGGYGSGYSGYGSGSGDSYSNSSDEYEEDIAEQFKNATGLSKYERVNGLSDYLKANPNSASAQKQYSDLMSTYGYSTADRSNAKPYRPNNGDDDKDKSVLSVVSNALKKLFKKK